jgi:hypothetical protein
MKKLLWLICLLISFNWIFAQGKHIGTVSNEALFYRGLKVYGAQELYFRDTGIYIESSTDGQLDLIADTEIQFAATTLDLQGALTLNGTIDPTIAITAAGGDRGINLSISQSGTALTGTLTGIRSNARVNVESASGTVMAGEFLAGNQSAGYSLSVVRGVYSGVTNKVPSGAVTWTYARAFEANMDLDQGTAGNTNTITNAYMFYGVYNLPTTGTYSTVTNGYGIYLRNEAVGGTGQALDAALYIDDASMSGGISGWDYGIDMNGVGASGFTVANIRLENGICVFSGAATTETAVYAEVGSVDATGSIYLSTGGELFVQVANAGAEADWETVTTTSVD